MKDIFEEAADDLKSERFNILFKKIAKIFIFIAIVTVILVAAKLFYDKRQTSIQTALSSKYQEALELEKKGSITDAIERFKNIYTESNHSFSAFAGLRYAKLMYQNQNFIESQKTFEEIYQNKSFANELRYLALYQFVNHYFNLEKIENPDQLRAKIKIGLNDSNPWLENFKFFDAMMDIIQNNKNEGLEKLRTLKNNVKSSEVFKEIIDSVIAGELKNEK